MAPHYSGREKLVRRFRAETEKTDASEIGGKEERERSKKRVSALKILINRSPPETDSSSFFL